LCVNICSHKVIRQYIFYSAFCFFTANLDGTINQKAYLEIW